MKEYVVERVKEGVLDYLELRLKGADEVLTARGVFTLAEMWAWKSEEEWKMEQGKDRLFTIPAKFTSVGSNGCVQLHEDLSSADLVELTERYFQLRQR